MILMITLEYSDSTSHVSGLSVLSTCTCLSAISDQNNLHTTKTEPSCGNSQTTTCSYGNSQTTTSDSLSGNSQTRTSSCGISKKKSFYKNTVINNLKDGH